MIEYFVVYAVIWALAIFHSSRRKLKSDVIYLLQGVLLLIFAAARFETGYDWPVYGAHYNGDAVGTGLMFEPGYELFVWIFVHLGVPFKYYLSVITAGMVIAVMVLIRATTPRYKEIAIAVAYSLPDLFLIPVFSVIRQTLSLLLLLLGLLCIRNEKRKLGYGLIVTSFLFHYSTLFIFLIVYIFTRLRVSDRRYIWFFAFFSVGYICSIDVFRYFMKLVIELVVPTYAYYLDKDTFNASFVYRIATAIITACVFFLIIKSRAYLNGKTDSFGWHAAVLSLLLPIFLFNFPTFTSRFLFLGAFFILGFTLYCVHDVLGITRLLSSAALSLFLFFPLYRFLSSPFSTPYVPYQSMFSYDERNSTGGERTQELLDMLDSLW